MITQKYHQIISRPELLNKYAEIDNILFFDIETTGLSPDSSFIYLISYGYFKGDKFFLTQLFAENMKDEISVLESFDKILPEFSLLAQFNGNRFDIPYVKARYKYHSLNSHISTLEYFDIYLYIKEFKNLFNTPNCKLKTFEKLLSIDRKDLIDGGEAINEYYNYVSTGNQDSLNVCLLHNYEDVLNLPELSKLIIFEHLKDITSLSFKAYTDNDNFIIEVDTGQCLNFSITHQYDDLEFIFNNYSAIIKLRMENNLIKLHFYQFKNYVFLNNENYAVESLYAKCLNLKNTKKCTLKNAYQYINAEKICVNRNDIVYLWNESYQWLLANTKSKK